MEQHQSHCESEPAALSSSRNCAEGDAFELSSPRQRSWEAFASPARVRWSGFSFEPVALACLRAERRDGRQHCLWAVRVSTYHYHQPVFPRFEESGVDFLNTLFCRAAARVVSRAPTVLHLCSCSCKRHLLAGVCAPAHTQRCTSKCWQAVSIANLNATGRVLGSSRTGQTESCL